jgi:hypothetical protein
VTCPHACMHACMSYPSTTCMLIQLAQASAHGVSGLESSLHCAYAWKQEEPQGGRGMRVGAHPATRRTCGAGRCRQSTPAPRACRTCPAPAPRQALLFLPMATPLNGGFPAPPRHAAPGRHWCGSQGWCHGCFGKAKATNVPPCAEGFVLGNRRLGTPKKGLGPPKQGLGTPKQGTRCGSSCANAKEHQTKWQHRPYLVVLDGPAGARSLLPGLVLGHREEGQALLALARLHTRMRAHACTDLAPCWCSSAAQASHPLPDRPICLH